MFSNNLENQSNSQNKFEDDFSVIVIDVGCHSTKIGFAGEDSPQEVFPTLVGRSLVTEIMVGMGQKEAYIGDEVESKRTILSIRNPIERGIIKYWYDMEELWKFCYFNGLRIIPEEHPLLLIEPPSIQKKKQREKITSIMFETFNVPAFYLANSGILSLYSSGKTTGIVLESGGGLSHCVPIYESVDLKPQTKRIDLGGDDCTDYLMKSLIEKGYSISPHYQSNIFNKFKEENCYVSFDFEEESLIDEKFIMKQKEIPEKQPINIGKERFESSEILFRPSLVGNYHQKGIHEMLYESIIECEHDLQKELFKNIVLSGGSTFFSGFEERLHKELSKVVNNSTDFEIISLPERRYGSWIGGSILGSLSTFQQIWISKYEYDDCGPKLIHRKCG
ncbi:actin-7-related [Anaeramoeba ignava]|uniref:Actin-7-related n=1 Tax=Anaeramoeba ignava TaxID=1746090 RepID=A0A9Q0LVZ5_ANAIG|nr:actin-7-related [Anaeramoeba ignava]